MAPGMKCLCMNYPSRQLLHQFGRLFQAITAQSGCLSLATFLLTCTPDSDKTTPLGVITGTSIARGCMTLVCLVGFCFPSLICFAAGLPNALAIWVLCSQPLVPLLLLTICSHIMKGSVDVDKLLGPQVYMDMPGMHK